MSTPPKTSVGTPWYTEARLISSGLVDSHTRNARLIGETDQWVRNFLGKPHPMLGRPGPVCPFVPRALALSSLHYTVLDTVEGSASELERQMEVLRQTFLELEPKQGNQALYKSILAIMPERADIDWGPIVDAVQAKLKPTFVESGMMVGEFHNSNMTPGLHNSEFFPLRSPYPMLVIRFMVDSDLVFMDRPEYPLEKRKRLVSGYVNAMTGKLPQEKLDAIAARVADVPEDPSI